MAVVIRKLFVSTHQAVSIVLPVLRATNQAQIARNAKVRSVNSCLEFASLFAFADINECQISSPCAYRSTCTNTQGSYTCSACPTGFKGTGTTSCDGNIAVLPTELVYIERFVEKYCQCFMNWL